MLSRRTLLHCGAALASAATVPGRILDAHAHFYDPTRPQGVPWPSRNEPLLYKPTYPERYVASVQPIRVDGLVAIEASPWPEDNRWLLEVADRNRLVWAVVGNIQPGRPEFGNELERFAEHPLFRGIRLNAVSVPAIIARPGAVADLKLLAAKDLSLDILVDAPSRFAAIARLARMLPDLRLVLGHLPLDPPRDEAGRAAYRGDLRALGGAPSVYAKASGVLRRVGGHVSADAGFYKPALDELWNTFGPDRVIHASNWPTCDLIAPYPVAYRVVRDYLADKDPRTVDRYFWKNAATVYRCGER